MCHSHHHRHAPSATAQNSELRASDSEREQTAGRLQSAAAEGRLAISELEGRLATAWKARTRGELAGLTSDLGGSSLGSRRRIPWFRHPALIWLVPVVIWLLGSTAWHALGL